MVGILSFMSFRLRFSTPRDHIIQIDIAHFLLSLESVILMDANLRIFLSQHVFHRNNVLPPSAWVFAVF